MDVSFDAFAASLPPYWRDERHTFGPFTFDIAMAWYQIVLRKPQPILIPTLPVYAVLKDHAQRMRESLPLPEGRSDINRPLLIATAHFGVYEAQSPFSDKHKLRLIQRQFLLDGRVRVVTAHHLHVTPLLAYVLNISETQQCCPELVQLAHKAVPRDTHAIDAFSDPFAESTVNLPQGFINEW